MRKKYSKNNYSDKEIIKIMNQAIKIIDKENPKLNIRKNSIIKFKRTARFLQNKLLISALSKEEIIEIVNNLEKIDSIINKENFIESLK